MLNSQNYARDTNIIRIGEAVSGEIPGKPGTKTWYHQVAGARTYLPDGAEINFTGGQYTSSNKEIIAFMDAICDKPGTLVYSRKPGSPITQEQADLAVEVSAPAGDSKENQGSVHATPQQTASLNQQVQANKPTAAQAITPVDSSKK